MSNSEQDRNNRFKAEVAQAVTEAVLCNKRLSAHFNAKAATTLGFILQDLYRISNETPRSYKEIVSNNALSWGHSLAEAFDEEWPEPEKPLRPNNNTDHDRIAYERRVATYKKQKSLYDKQRPAALKWFIQQALKSYPGRRNAVSNDEIRASLPDPVGTQMYDEHVRALKWFLTELPLDSDKMRTVQDLKGKNLHDIFDAYNEVFTSDITSQHLVICDRAFLDQPIPPDTLEIDRHPNNELVTTHAEIVAKGKCKDGIGWTMRRLNSREAAKAYGNPSRKRNNTNLCFARDDDDAFSSYNEDLLMLCRNDGANARFIHLRSDSYMNFDDKAVNPATIFKMYPGSEKAVSLPLKQEVMRALEKDEIEQKESFLETVKFWLANCSANDPDALIVIPAVIDIIVRTPELLDSRELPELFEAFSYIPKWEKACMSVLPAHAARLLVTGDRDCFDLLLQHSPVKTGKAFLDRFAKACLMYLENEDTKPSLKNLAYIAEIFADIDSDSLDTNLSKIVPSLFRTLYDEGGWDDIYQIIDSYFIPTPKTDKVIARCTTQLLLEELENPDAKIENTIESFVTLGDIFWRFSQVQKNKIFAAAIERAVKENKVGALKEFVTLNYYFGQVPQKSLKQLFNAIVTHGEVDIICSTIEHVRNNQTERKIFTPFVAASLNKIASSNSERELSSSLYYVSTDDDWEQAAVKLAKSKTTDPLLSQKIKQQLRLPTL